MKRILAVFIFLLFSTTMANAQKTDTLKLTGLAADTLIFTHAEHEPQFPSSFGYSLFKLIQSIKAESSNYPTGIMVIQFLVEKDGSLTRIKVIKTLTPELDEKVIKFVKSSSKWHPAIQNGKTVRCMYILPVRFN